MSRLLLHIGHHKTGSSYIQSSFAVGVSILKAVGITYSEPDASGLASKGMISSGNGVLFERLAAEDRPPMSLVEMFSSEFLFSYFLQERFQNAFRRYAQHFDRIDVLLFIRDPVAYTCSRYQQAIKRDGYTGDVAMFFKTENKPSEVKQVMEFLSSIQSVNLTVLNYSACSDAIIPKVEDWLGLLRGTLPIPPMQIVNRSMTFPELEAQRMLNVGLGPSGHLLSDFLCNELPMVQSDDVRPAIVLQAELWERLAPDISWVNDRVSETERYSKDRDVQQPTLLHDGTFSFSDAQFRILMREFARPHVDARTIIDAQRKKSEDAPLK